MGRQCRVNTAQAIIVTLIRARYLNSSPVVVFLLIFSTRSSASAARRPDIAPRLETISMRLHFELCSAAHFQLQSTPVVSLQEQHATGYSLDSGRGVARPCRARGSRACFRFETFTANGYATANLQAHEAQLSGWGQPNRPGPPSPTVFLKLKSQELMTGPASPPASSMGLFHSDLRSRARSWQAFSTTRLPRRIKANAMRLHPC